jgi:hypothetical protein
MESTPMAEADGEKPVDKNNEPPPGHGDVVVFTPQELQSEPTIQLITSRRIASGKISFDALQHVSFAKVSAWLILVGGVTAGALGFILGAVLGAIEIARISALIGAALLGGLGGLIALRVGLNANNQRRGPLDRAGGALVVALVCGAIGGLAGAVVVAFAGILCGAIIGSCLGAMFRRDATGIGSGFLLGSLLGPLVLALYLDKAKALEWGLHGAWVAAAAAMVFLGLTVLSARLKIKRARSAQES